MEQVCGRIFTTHVAEGRNLPVEKVRHRRGRVWSGEDALGIGLTIEAVRRSEDGHAIAGQSRFGRQPGDRLSSSRRDSLPHRVAQRKRPRGHDLLGTGTAGERIQAGAGGDQATGVVAYYPINWTCADGARQNDELQSLCGRRPAGR